MAKLNANTSIVDYLKSQGKASSYDDRKKLAKQLGIKNYTGSPQQNQKMITLLTTGDGKVPNQGIKPTVGTNPVKIEKPTVSVKSLTGVDQSLVDKANSQFEQSTTVTDAQDKAQGALSNVEALGSVTDIVDQSTWDALNTPFTASSAYQEAMAYTNGLLEQLSSGRTSYTDQIKEMMDKIQNRDEFQYDISTDTLFQQSLASAMASGQTAMRDTIGQASALTGGYGSTYATSVGNQAYSSFIQDAYANLPEYYQMAMEAYQMEGQEMYDQLAMLNTADANEYQRMYDSWSSNFANAQQMYQNEYEAWQDGVNNALNNANLQIKEHGQAYDQALSTYSALQSNANTLYEQEYKKWADEVSVALDYAKMQNDDYWSNKTNTGSGSDGGSGGSDSGSNLKDPTETQMAKALEAYNAGGMDALNQYINSVPSTVNRDAIAEYVGAYGNYDTKDNPLPLNQRTFTIVDDGGINWLGGVDNNVIVRDQYGNEYRLGDLKKEDKNLAKKLSNKHLGVGQTFSIN